MQQTTAARLPTSSSRRPARPQAPPAPHAPACAAGASRDSGDPRHSGDPGGPRHSGGPRHRDLQPGLRPSRADLPSTTTPAPDVVVDRIRLRDLVFSDGFQIAAFLLVFPFAIALARRVWVRSGPRPRWWTSRTVRACSASSRRSSRSRSRSSASARNDTTLHAEVTDDGCPFDPLSHELPEAPTDLQSAQIGGLGIKLMRSFAGDVVYQRCGATNRLTLSFPIQGPMPKEIGGPKGPEPTRYGDWEVNGRCSDF